ncbi:MAG: peptidoglycan editing factor PgeF [Bacteroidales bacterium]
MLPLIRFNILSESNNVYNYITTRNGGVSQDEYSSFNLSINSGDNLQKVYSNRELLAHYLGISNGHLIFANQIHGDRTYIIDDQFIESDNITREKCLAGVDALITNIPGIAINVLTADCVPILLYCPTKRVIAAIHAGWRGVVTMIVQKTVNRMIDLFECDPSAMIAGIGPSISIDNFEVGDEVAEQFKNTGFDIEQISFLNPKSQKRHFDLQKANKQLLIDSGLSEKNIEIIDTCTFTNNDIFFSARRQGILSGRQAAGILLNS